LNICTILTGSRDHDLLCKLAWAIPLEKHGHKVFIVGRTNQQHVISMYDEPYKEYPIQLQQDMEKWLGLSFKYISSLDWRGFDKRDCKDIKNIKEVNQYLTFLTIWYQDFYIKNKIDAVTIAFESFPWCLIAYYVAKKMGIPTVNIMSSRFPKKGFMFGNNDYSTIHEWNSEPYPDWSEIESLYPFKERCIQTGGLSNYWSIQNVKNNTNKAIQYLKTQRTMEYISPYEKIALLPLKTEIDRMFWSTVKGIFNKIFWKEPLDEEFFFYPFHFEDDSNITIMEPFTNQVELVQALSRSMPLGAKLYIKPHPAYMGIDIRFRDLLHLNKLPNVRIIHPLVSPISLIKKCVAVITLNSTTGFEAMIQDKPVISLGHDFYCHVDHCYLVREWGRLPSVISKVYRERKSPLGFERFQDFAKRIYLNTVWTEGDIAFAEDPLTPSDGEKIALALDRIFKKLEKLA
jgi:hypothetical protein